MKRTVLLGALLVAVLACSLALSTPTPLHALRCCDYGGYSTSQHWVMKPTCSEAQSAFRAEALPEAQAFCNPDFACAITIPGCYTFTDENGVLWYVVDGWMYFGCTYYCEREPYLQ
ncbi:MAG TPA: hypothetical protein VGG03_09120 [Thermoanaerobaculia bacterium]